VCPCVRRTSRCQGRSHSTGIANGSGSTAINEKRPPRTLVALAALCMWTACLPSIKADCELCNTQLTFTSPVAGVAGPMTVQIRFVRQFVQGDSVVLKLPGFSRKDGSTTSYANADTVAYAQADIVGVVESDGVPSSAFRAVSWDEPGSLLTLHHINPVKIVPNTLLRITVSANSQVRLPGIALTENREDFLIKAVAADGSIYTPFERITYTQPVGVLYNSSLVFEPALPLTVTAISLNFTASIGIDQGETATLKLEGFSVAESTVVNCSMIICTDMWLLSRSCDSPAIMSVGVSSSNSKSVLLTFTFPENLEDGGSVTITVPTKAGIVAPAGSDANNHKLLLGSQSLAGPVVDAPVEVSNRIPRNSILYRPSKAATGECTGHDLTNGACTVWKQEQVDIDVNVVLDDDAVRGDQVVITLPGFSRKNARQTVPREAISRQACTPDDPVSQADDAAACDVAFQLTGPSAEVIKSALWEESMGTFRLQFNDSVTAGSLVSFTIPAQHGSVSGLLIPTQGLVINDPRITWWHNTTAIMPASKAERLISPSVGAFVNLTNGGIYASSMLIFPAPPSPALCSDMAVVAACQAENPYDVGLLSEACFINISLFFGGQTPTAVTDQMLEEDGGYSGLRLSGHSACLSARTKEDVTPECKAALGIPCKVTITPVAGGLPVPGEFGFTFSAELATSQCIAFCGTKVQVPLPFSVDRTFLGPVTISLRLPGFTRAGGNLDHIEIPGTSAFPHASWVQASHTLILTTKSLIPTGTKVSIRLPTDAGISLPDLGVTHNSAKLRVATNSLAGPVVDASIADTPALGSISGAHVSFSPAKAGVPVTLTFKFSYSQRVDAREYFLVTLPAFWRKDGLPEALDPSGIECTVDGSETPLYVYWIKSIADDDDPKLKMLVGAGGIAERTSIVVILKQSNQIFLREAGTPAVAKRSYWRVVNNTAVKDGWSISDLVLYSDPSCKTSIPTPHPLDTLGSSGANITTHMNCHSFVWSDGEHCPSGYRRARFVEIANCKLALCDVLAKTEFLVGQGDGAYFLGAAHGCQVLSGTSPYAGADNICVHQEGAAYNAFDGQSATSWMHSKDSNASSEVYVGMRFDQKVAVHCALVEQERFDANWSVSSIALQSSPDGLQWATIIKGPVVRGVNLLWRPEGPKDSKGFDSITIETPAVRGPCKHVRVAAMPVGSFGSSSSLNFGNPNPGQISNVTLTVTPEMEIDIGERIEMKLNGFVGNASNSLALLVRYRKPVFDGNDYIFVERSFYNNGSSETSRSTKALLESSQESQLGSDAVSSEESHLFSATWDPDLQIVVIKCGVVIYPGQKLAVTVLESNGLRLPDSGIAPSACGTGPTVAPLSCGKCNGCSGVNENTLTIACDAHAGPVLPTVIRNVQRVGFFFNTSIDFSALNDVNAVDISVNFTYDKEFLTGDTIFLHLPGFTGNFAHVQTSGLHSYAIGSATWEPLRGLNDSLLALVVSNDRIAAHTPIQVSIPSTAGVILRSDGFVKNSPVLKLSTNAINGPVFPRPFDSSPAMGSFTTGQPSSLHYNPATVKADGSPYMEGRLAAIIAGFALNREISPGEHVYLNLFGFSRDAGDSVEDLIVTDTNGIFDSFTRASWSESTQRLTLTASQTILPNQRHSVLIPSSAGLRLPGVGLQQNDPRLTIGTNAVLGPNSGTPIASSPSLNKLCGAECGAWAFTCGSCRCGPCADEHFDFDAT
jgi:hypothetical protein